jgi:alpha 1,2-mannosyltransferase
MIRWQSGLFYLHPALKDYDYYWRVEPDVHFFCAIHYDPFRFMHANEMVYGFNMAILDDARSFASLWSTTRDFMTENPDLVHPDANLGWLLDPATGLNYNNCQFFSNFEIGSLKFFRENEGVRRYFDWLEEKGGFYYSRWGDAPVHTLMVSMFASPDKTWWFRDIGYQHNIARHCPPHRNLFTGIHDLDPPENHVSRNRYPTWSKRLGTYVDDMGWPLQRCLCYPTSLDENFYKLVPMESPQIKPSDTCIRLWLGGEWLEKKEGWRQDAERILGGDGYGGYVLDGL